MRKAAEDFLVQQLWWVLGTDERQLAFHKRGLWTHRRQRQHLALEREVHVGLLSGGTRFPNIIDLNAFWMNERCTRCRFSVDPTPGTADVLWVFSQDPLTDTANAAIAAAQAVAKPGTRLLNAPAAHDFYHRPDAFQRLAAASIPVPQSVFSDADKGRPVLWKPVGGQSKVRGPEPYAGPVPGWRPFEFVDTSGPDGSFGRYRAFYVFGAVYPGSRLVSRQPIVRLGVSFASDLNWQLSAAEIAGVKAIARESGLDFFATDYLRRQDGTPVFTDINAFPMLKTTRTATRMYGHMHDFDDARLSEYPEPPPPPVWQHIDDFLAGLKPPVAAS
jgi:hypothetical protein